MNTLYVIHISTGLPRQIKWRTRRTVVVTGATKKEASTRALAYVQQDLLGEWRPRIDDVRVLCTTSDDVLTGAIT